MRLLDGCSRVLLGGATGRSFPLHVLKGVLPSERGDSPTRAVCALGASRSEKAARFLSRCALGAPRSERAAPSVCALRASRSEEAALSLPQCELGTARSEKAAQLRVRALCVSRGEGGTSHYSVLVPTRSKRVACYGFALARDVRDRWA